MPNPEFKTDWLAPDGIEGPELSATWASLRIEAGGSIVTRVLDERSQTVRDVVYVPLYPLAEWLAINWWFLAHEFENPLKKGDPAFRRRHALGAGREGYAFPDLEIVSSGARVRLAWTSGRSRWAGVEFLTQGQAWIDVGDFRESCANLIEKVVRRLDALDVHDTHLQEEWAAIRAADRDEAEFCGTAAGLGWDPYALDDEDRARVLELAEALPGTVLEEAAAAIDPRNLSADCAAISRAIDSAGRNGLALERLRPVREEIRRDERPAPPNPWTEGYELAQRIRRNLELDGVPLPTMTDIEGALGEAPGSLERMPPVDFGGAALVDGVVARDDEGNPAFALRTLRGDNGRFLFCRALAEMLAPPGPGALLTRAYTERQQRGRAFAAEFLAPSSGLRAKVSRRVVDEEDINELAETFGVSSLVVKHQIENHRIARIWSDTR